MASELDRRFDSGEDIHDLIDMSKATVIQAQPSRIVTMVAYRKVKQKSPPFLVGSVSLNLGNVLLSHTASHAVPSALKGLTSVFEMGTGVSPSLWSPRNLEFLK